MKPSHLRPWPPAAGLGPPAPAQDAMPATPQAAASPAPDWRAAAPAATAAAAAAAAANSVLDGLLATLGDGDIGPSAHSDRWLQPLAVQPLPALPAAQRVPPGAPRRLSRPLPPPPEVPPAVLAALHPRAPAAGASPFASCAGAGPWADTACSGWEAAAAAEPDVHPALLQAFAWLDTCQTSATGELP